MRVNVKAAEAKHANDARVQLVRLEKASAAAIVLDLQADWIAAAAPAVKVPLLNSYVP